MDKILNWFIVSSANPDEYSLTLKSLLLAGAGNVVAGLQTLGLNVSLASYTGEIGHAVAVVGVLLSAFGFARKIFLTTQTTVSSKG